MDPKALFLLLLLLTYHAGALVSIHDAQAQSTLSSNAPAFVLLLPASCFPLKYQDISPQNRIITQSNFCESFYSFFLDLSNEPQQQRLNLHFAACGSIANNQFCSLLGATAITGPTFVYREEQEWKPYTGAPNFSSVAEKIHALSKVPSILRVQQQQQQQEFETGLQKLEHECMESSTSTSSSPTNTAATGTFTMLGSQLPVWFECTEYSNSVNTNSGSRSLGPTDPRNPGHLLSSYFPPAQHQLKYTSEPWELVWKITSVSPSSCSFKWFRQTTMGRQNQNIE